MKQAEITMTSNEEIGIQLDFTSPAPIDLVNRLIDKVDGGNAVKVHRLFADGSISSLILPMASVSGQSILQLVEVLNDHADRHGWESKEYCVFKFGPKE